MRHKCHNFNCYLPSSKNAICEESSQGDQTTEGEKIKNSTMKLQSECAFGNDLSC